MDQKMVGDTTCTLKIYISQLVFNLDMTIMNSDIREITIQNACQELVSLYPELTSMYTEKHHN